MSVSKKKTVWIQAKLTCDMTADEIKTGDKFKCEKQKDNEDDKQADNKQLDN